MVNGSSYGSMLMAQGSWLMAKGAGPARGSGGRPQIQAWARRAPWPRGRAGPLGHEPGVMNLVKTSVLKTINLYFCDKRVSPALELCFYLQIGLS